MFSVVRTGSSQKFARHAPSNILRPSRAVRPSSRKDCAICDEVIHSSQVVGGKIEQGMRTNLVQPAQFDAPEHSDFLYPSEGLLDHFAPAKADRVSGACLDILGHRTVTGLGCDVRQDVSLLHLLDEVGDVITAIGRHCRRVSLAAAIHTALEHREGRFSLGHPGRLRRVHIDHQPVPVLPERMRGVAQIGHARRLGCQQRHTESQESSLLSKIPVSDVWGVGYRITKRLEQMGVRTALDLRNADADLIRERFGVVLSRTVAELKGVSCLHLEDVRPPKKQIMNSRSFGRLVTDIGELREAVVMHATRAAEKQRTEGCAAGGVYVFIQSNPFREQDKQYQASRYMPLPTVTQDTRRIVAAALQGLEDMYAPGINYKKAGVMLCELVDHAVQQTDLFCETDSPRSERLMAVLDGMNRKFGSGTAVFAGSGLRRTWAMRSDMKSQNYTTRWNELPVAYAH